MPRYIIHHNNKYNIFSTIVDAPIYDGGLDIKQLTEEIKYQHGQEGLTHLADRLDRAHKTGTSSLMDVDLADTVDYFLQKEEINLQEFIERYLS